MIRGGIRTRIRAASRRAQTGRRKSSIPTRLRGLTRAGWGVDPASLVIYELHVGTYTPEGTFEAIIAQLDALRDLGVSAIELMPVCEFPGKHNWGYDVADLYAPSSAYGSPDGLRRLVDAAHAQGLGVMLDVVYNHLGPDGNYLRTFVPDALTDRYQTPWGEAINFDGVDCALIRRYFIDNALYWLHEFHIDGLRLDAAHEMFDAQQPHILAEIADAVHERMPSGKRCLLVAEDRGNQLRLMAPAAAGGYSLDGMWVDDFHHTVYVRLSGEREGYLGAYKGSNEEIAQLLNNGLLYSNADGVTPASVEQVSPAQLIYCLQNHDQVGNGSFGLRLADIIGLELYKTAYALLLLVPCTPLIFMGDEFAASTPFLYFTELNAELARGSPRRAAGPSFMSSGPRATPAGERSRTRKTRRRFWNRSSTSANATGGRTMAFVVCSASCCRCAEMTSCCERRTGRTCAQTPHRTMSCWSNAGTARSAVCSP